MTGMRILVTGHTGYIGSVLTPMLLACGHKVTGLDSDLFQNCLFTGELSNVPSLKLDVRDVPAQALAGFDAIIHLAGLSNDPLGDYKPHLTNDINHLASVRLARMAAEAGVERFVFASSCSNYGAAGDDFLDERSEFNPVTPYGKSKVLVERDVSKLASDTFSPTFLRASTAYGMSPKIRFDLVVNNLTAWAFTTGEVHLKSDGTPWRPIVHVEDIAQAYIATVESDRSLVHNRAFNVGSTSENYQIHEIAAIVRDVVPGSKIGFADGAAPDTRNYRVDCNLISKTLHNFKPQWTLRRGVEQLYSAYRTVGLTLEEFEGKKFKRIAHIKEMVADKVLDDSLRRTEMMVAT